MRYNRLKIGMDDVGSFEEPMSSLAWADANRTDFQVVISRYIRNITTCLSCRAQRGLRTIFIQKSKLKYIYLATPILRPLWLMKSAAVDVISNPRVEKCTQELNQGLNLYGKHSCLSQEIIFVCMYVYSHSRPLTGITFQINILFFKLNVQPSLIDGDSEWF